MVSLRKHSPPAKPRRRAEDEHPHRDRWLVSYADFITLLFAFFVVMYAISTLNEGKYRVLSDALMSAFRNEHAISPPVSELAPRVNPSGLPPRPLQKPVDPVRRAREQQLVGLASKLTAALKPLVQSGQVRLRQDPRGLAVEINASVLFAPARAELRPESSAALAAVAQVLIGVDNAIQVEGHTDPVPIASSQYPSNWELASARASSVVRLFVANGVEHERLIVLGYADNRPVEENDTPEGRARNRRVTLLILSDRNPDGGDGKAPTPRS